MKFVIAQNFTALEVLGWRLYTCSLESNCNNLAFFPKRETMLNGKHCSLRVAQIGAHECKAPWIRTLFTRAFWAGASHCAKIYALLQPRFLALKRPHKQEVSQRCDPRCAPVQPNRRSVLARFPFLQSPLWYKSSARTEPWPRTGARGVKSVGAKFRGLPSVFSRVLLIRFKHKR